MIFADHSSSEHLASSLWVCRYAPDQRTVADMEGRINNFIDVSGFKPFNEDSSTLDIARKEDEVGAASRDGLLLWCLGRS